jgi:hypothetical protein
MDQNTCVRVSFRPCPRPRKVPHQRHRGTLIVVSFEHPNRQILVHALFDIEGCGRPGAGNGKCISARHGECGKVGQADRLARVRPLLFCGQSSSKRGVTGCLLDDKERPCCPVSDHRDFRQSRIESNLIDACIVQLPRTRSGQRKKHGNVDSEESVSFHLISLSLRVGHFVTFPCIACLKNSPDSVNL